MTLGLRQRLTLGTLFLFGLLLLSAGLGIFQLDRLSRDAQAILEDNYETARYVQAMQQALLDGDRSVFEHALKKQEANITEPGEAEVTGRLRRDFSAWANDAHDPDCLPDHLLQMLEPIPPAVGR